MHRYCLALFVCLPLALVLPLPSAQAESSPQDAFWEALSSLCGQAHAGRLVSYDEDMDAGWLPETLSMHVRHCEDDRIQIPLFVGEDRSRTWVLTRLDDGLRLKHDHRLEDGSEDRMTWYGGHTRDPGRSWRQAFPVDDYSRALFHAGGLDGSIENIWYVEVVPGSHFAYGLTRTGRHLRVEFDLGEEIDTPAAAWGHD